jgi:outer membrane biosynthesis protein TonB
MSARTTKSSTRSTNGNAKPGTNTSLRRADPQLGELEFSEWYETPVFEPSSEERMETRASGGRGPMRLVARVFIAAGARRESRRAKHEQHNPESEAPVEAVTVEQEPQPPLEAELQPEQAAAAEAEPEPEPEPTATIDPEPEPEPEPEPPATIESTEPGADEPQQVVIPELADRSGWRSRASALIDRWAEKEVAVATKLDEALAPAIPWVGGRKPAHSRRSRPD